MANIVPLKHEYYQWYCPHQNCLKLIKIKYLKKKKKKVTNCKWSLATIWQIMFSLTNVTITAQITESLVKEKIDKTANPAVISSIKLFSDT